MSLSAQKLLLAQITALETNPRPTGCKKLKGRQNEYRIRSGNYRVIYTIEDTALIVRIIRASHRRDAYD
ncbi:MAG: type II toxin-antitoxin system mRNA interferase toxin, RelE/StbE family [Phormidesmis priestleyi]|uniref:Type II toxin-antitoxin system mRNA interferase toxin, RelE/StbE family n=1 Tax=Phormidesmis priestleyi TaxID=268141 RepID=A0A2W4ZG05_9CYAN|nr:MAG: type II toxin-antitoxin system mRNA interferase toxin, RelE/StbE family [Phormidesmis priestleyi]